MVKAAPRPRPRILRIIRALKARDPEKISIERFVRRASRLIPAGAVVLDAGAGDAPYRGYFRHVRYITADLAATGYHEVSRLDLICNLSALPLAGDTFDAVLCTQVLEHVPDPQQVLAELYRVLRPGGRLFLTVPQSWELHEAPYDYFRFTRYGLELMFQQAGFERFEIQPRGGYFYFLAERIRHLPGYLPGFVEGRGLWRVPGAHRLMTLLFHHLLPALLMAMDRFDTRKLETLGYACIAVKGCSHGRGPILTTHSVQEREGADALGGA